MTPKQFVYWLQGFMEVQNPEQLSQQQTQIIKDHLGLVLGKVTPERNIPAPVKKPFPSEAEIRELTKRVEDEMKKPSWWQYRPMKPAPVLRCAGANTRLYC